MGLKFYHILRFPKHFGYNETIQISQTAIIFFLEPENTKILNNGKWSRLITVFRGLETPSLECTAQYQPKYINLVTKTGKY